MLAMSISGRVAAVITLWLSSENGSAGSDLYFLRSPSRPKSVGMGLLDFIFCEVTQSIKEHESTPLNNFSMEKISYCNIKIFII